VGLRRTIVLVLGAVVLLLLLAVPIATVRIKIDLPPAVDAKPPRPAKPVDIFIDEDGAIRVDGRPSSLDTLARDVTAVSTVRDKREQLVRIRGAKTLEYAAYMAVLQRLQGAGWYKVGLVNQDLH
jgi:biopolymer transport protein ExbD